MKLSVVFSFYNEQENLPELLRRTRKVLIDGLNLSKAEYELIFVNDCSRDRSEEILQDSLREHGDITIINTSRNFGNAACILAGFSFCSGEYIAYLDSDLQDPPELIEKLYLKAKSEKLDIVHTKRTKRHGENPIKMFVTNVGYALMRRMMDVPVQSNVGDFKILSKRVVDSVLKMHEPFPFIRGMISYVGFRSAVIEYERDPRYGGVTHFPLYDRRIFANFINNAVINYSDLPIHLILYLSALGLTTAGLLVAYALFTKIMGMSTPGSSGVIIVVTIFSSVILMAVGILGLYMTSIKRAVLNRPNFIIDHVQSRDSIHNQKVT